MNFLHKENDFEALNVLLNDLDRRLIPRGPLNFYDLKIKNRVRRAMGGIADLANAFDGLTNTSDFEATHLFHRQCVRMLIERWQNVMEWMAFFLATSKTAANNRDLVAMCTRSMVAFINDPSHTLDKDELLSIPSTTDILCLIICQTDYSVTPENYYYVLNTPTTNCEIAALVVRFVTDYGGRPHLISRLKSVSRGIRRRVLQSLIKRSREIVSLCAAKNPGVEQVEISAAIPTIQYLLRSAYELIQVDPYLLRYFLRLDLVFQFCAAISAASIVMQESRFTSAAQKEELWSGIGYCVVTLYRGMIVHLAPSPSRSMEQAIRGGILDCVIHCSEDLCGLEQKTEVLDVLTSATAHLNVSGVFWAATRARFGYYSLLGMMESLSRSEYGSVAGAFCDGYSHCSRAFEDRRSIHVEMCHSLKVTERSLIFSFGSMV